MSHNACDFRPLTNPKELFGGVKIRDHSQMIEVERDFLNRSQKTWDMEIVSLKNKKKQ